ncbi:NAD dependent epimerase/dehydratase family protein [Aeromicrobium marinum DSM 15272]|uniref:NAD dependent epimerase/dehydratase family protein n=1 Tax=Aeromicrobium marinum DSM 15272 TaxID=585531 RepID=E2SC19_9ACTN|nr:NAD-dependent epimerase/dehydratase family protein [Aeromicrobium marinum]EFQ83305.1 NAD dependent epimerase/dehydratase family protein [Aeromicrobium marinum DSM 15272]
MGKVVLVTGVSSAFASRAARRLADEPGIDKVVGVDTVLPAGDLTGVKFVRADIRTPVIGKVLAVEDVDTVVHLDLSPSTRGRAAGKELNVIGTMQVLAACQRSSVVRKFVLGSSSAVYGSSPRDPAMFLESTAARAGVKVGFPKDAVEVESYVRGFARRRPDVIITTLRSAQILDAEIRSPLGDYFRNPVLPAALGYDPRLQFTHLEDALTVVVQAVRGDRPGTFNVAGDGVLLLSQAARRLGKPIIPLPPFGFATGARQVIRAVGSSISPDLHRLLMYGRALDTTALREIFGYEPTYTTEQVFDQYRRAIRPGILAPIGGRS